MRHWDARFRLNIAFWGGKEFSKRKGETKNKRLEEGQPLTHRLWVEEQGRNRARRYREPKVKRLGRAGMG